MPLGLSQTLAPIVELSADIFVGKTTIAAVEASPGWHVLGEYRIPKSTPALLYAILCVSASGLTARVRFWCVDDAEALDSPVVSTSLVPAHVTSGEVNLEGGKRYQIQAECTGAAGDDKFGVILSAGVT
jgi:hypothetical protein